MPPDAYAFVSGPRMVSTFTGVVRAAGGWLFDRVSAGWDVIVLVADHTAYHVGQIVYLAKHFRGAEWDSLSIPKKR